MVDYTARILQTGNTKYMNFEERQALKEQKREEMQKKSKGNLIDAIKDKYYCSTGVYNLDKALHGGIPFGRLIEYYGLQSSGKCKTKDSLILTADNGYMTIEELFKSQGLDILNTKKEVPLEYDLVNYKGERESTTHFTYNSKKKVKQVTTKSGFKTKCTYNHPLMVLSESCNLIWKRTSEIVKGDYLVSLRNCDYFGKNKLKSEEAYALGLIIADAHMSDRTISVTNDDPDVKQFISDILPNILGCSFIEKDNNGRGSVQYDFNNTAKVAQFYEKYELCKCIAKDKFVPKCILSGTRETVFNFLAGYLDSESFVVDNSLEVCSASYELLRMVKYLISQTGISSSISEKTANNYPDNTYWRLLISGQDYNTFMKEYLNYSRSEKMQNKFIDNPKSRDENIIPNSSKLIRDFYDCSEETSRETSKLMSGIYGGCSISEQNLRQLLKILPKSDLNQSLFDKLSNLLNYKFDEVISVEDLGEELTYDFSMKTTSSFIADGVVNHNTLNAYKAMAQCNRVNYETGEIDDTYENPCSTCLFDLELTSEPDWERKLGYFRDEYGNNVDQANGGDTVHDAVLSMINDDMYSMIVIDSTYRMMPSEILEADYETTDVGRRAKCLSKCCNSWTTALFKSAKRNEGKPWRVPCILLLSHAMPIFMDPYGRMISDAGKKIPYMMTQQVFFSKLKIEESTSSKFGTGKFKGTVKKCKVGGPAGYVAEYNVALSDLDNLKQGQVDNVKSIFADIKDLELMQKVKGGYEIMGEHYDKQSDFKDRMYEDLTFQANTWKEVIERSKTRGLEFDQQAYEDSKLLERG